MSNSVPDPFLAQTGYDDEAWINGSPEEEQSFTSIDEGDDELLIEEERARER